MMGLSVTTCQEVPGSPEPVEGVFDLFHGLSVTGTVRA